MVTSINLHNEKKSQRSSYNSNSSQNWISRCGGKNNPQINSVSIPSPNKSTMCRLYSTFTATCPISSWLSNLNPPSNIKNSTNIPRIFNIKKQRFNSSHKKSLSRCNWINRVILKTTPTYQEWIPIIMNFSWCNWKEYKFTKSTLMIFVAVFSILKSLLTF